MPYLTPSYVAEESYGAGTGTVDLSWTTAQGSLEAGDIFVLFVECRASQAPSASFGSWTYLASNANTDGTLAGCAIFLHRYDGTTLPTITGLPDTGNHTSYSLHTIRDVDRNLALTSFAFKNMKDDTADTTMEGRVCDPVNDGINGANAALESGREALILSITAGATNHGGTSSQYVTAAGSGWSGGTVIRCTGHTNGSGGTHMTTRILCSSSTTGTSTPGATVSNSMANVGQYVALIGHAYSALTRSVSDGLTSGDSIGRLAGYGRGLADALDLADAVGRLGAYTRGLADSVGLAESLARVQGWVRGTYETVSLADAAGRIIGKIRATADALTLTDDVARHFAVIRALSDALGLADVATRSRGKIRAVADAVTLSDSLRYLKSGVRAVVTATLAVLAEIVATIKPLTWITDTISTKSAGTAITTRVGPLTDVETTVDPLTSIDVEIE